MLFRMIYDDSLAQAAYLIGCQRTGEAILFDAERDIDRYLKLAEKEKVRIVAVAETHIHADFLSGSRELAEKTGARLYLSGEGGPDWNYRWLDKKAGGGGGAYTHTLLKNGDTFKVGNIEFKAIHTPGHTPEHLCYLVTDRGAGAAEPMGVITGDFLFVGDVGRPDLLETAAGKEGAKEPSAKALFKSIQSFLGLPEYLQVWPAHGAGSACGKALGAVPQSTIGYERRFNPSLLAATNEAKFVSYILDGQPDPPLYFARMKRDNRDGPPVLGAFPAPRELDAQALAALDTKKTWVIDTRPWAKVRAGHMVGAIYAPPGANFVPVAGSYVPDGAPICLICEQRQADELTRRLVRVGLDRVESFATPATLDAAAAASGGGGKGMALQALEEIDAAEFARRRKDQKLHALVLDVRRTDENAASRIPGALNVPHVRLAGRLEDIPKDRPILCHCLGGGRSSYACMLLQRMGHTAINLAGGFGAWEKSGGEVEK